MHQESGSRTQDRQARVSIRRARAWAAAVLLAGAAAAGLAAEAPARVASLSDGDGAGDTSVLDRLLGATLRQAGFTGRVDSSFQSRLGRAVNPRLADVGRKLFFDPISGLHNDNACGGCHAPNAAMGDTQSIAIGVQSNMRVGPQRQGPRNQRRTPTVLNVAFFPTLMLNARFGATSGNPFDNSQGFFFPLPEGTTRFPAHSTSFPHLLTAHAHMPITELTEAAGFTGTRGTVGPLFDQFDDGLGVNVPLPDAQGYRNEQIRDAVMARLNRAPAYVGLFGSVFPEVRDGAPITTLMYARAIAEFEFTLVRANAPLDQFARGDTRAMSASEKRGALLFFGKAGCVACHAVAGQSNEMFSDFRNHVIGVPQIAPAFGVGKGNVLFDGPGADEDFGMEQVTGQSADRYKFRTAPLRNVALQTAFFHNGAYTRLEDAIRHHLDVPASARGYNPHAAGVALDLAQRRPPMVDVLQRVDPLLQMPIRLSRTEFQDLVRFVGDSLLDTRAKDENFCRLVPTTLPSGMRPMTFQNCRD